MLYYTAGQGLSFVHVYVEILSKVLFIEWGRVHVLVVYVWGCVALEPVIGFPVISNVYIAVWSCRVFVEALETAIGFPRMPKPLYCCLELFLCSVEL